MKFFFLPLLIFALHLICVQPRFLSNESRSLLSGTPFFNTAVKYSTAAVYSGYRWIGRISDSSSIGNVYGSLPNFSGSLATNKLESPESLQSSEEVISTGKSKFEIVWSVTLTTTKVLKTPKIESINFIETVWS
jgi:hypothetical protein